MLFGNDLNLAIDLLELAKRGSWKQLHDSLDDVKKPSILIHSDKSSPEPILVLAARAEQDDLVKALITNHGVNVNCRGIEQRTALFVYACNRADKSMVQWLMAHGANPRIREVAPRARHASYDEDKPSHDHYEYTLVTSPLKRLFQLVLQSNQEYTAKHRLNSYPRHYQNEAYINGNKERKAIIRLLLQERGIVASERRLLKQYVAALNDSHIAHLFEEQQQQAWRRKPYSVRDAKHALCHGSWKLLETILGHTTITGASLYQRQFVDLCVGSVLGTRPYCKGSGIPTMPIEKCVVLVPLMTRNLKTRHASKLHNFLQKFPQPNATNIVDPERLECLVPFLAKGAYLYQSNAWIRAFDHGHNTATDSGPKVRRQEISLLQWASQHGDQALCQAIVENAPNPRQLLQYRGKANRLAHQLVENDTHLQDYLKNAYTTHCLSS